MKNCHRRPGRAAALLLSALLWGCGSMNPAPPEIPWDELPWPELPQLSGELFFLEPLVWEDFPIQEEVADVPVPEDGEEVKRAPVVISLESGVISGLSTTSDTLTVTLPGGEEHSFAWYPGDQSYYMTHYAFRVGTYLRDDTLWLVWKYPDKEKDSHMVICRLNLATGEQMQSYYSGGYGLRVPDPWVYAGRDSLYFFHSEDSNTHITRYDLKDPDAPRKYWYTDSLICEPYGITADLLSPDQSPREWNPEELARQSEAMPHRQALVEDGGGVLHCLAQTEDGRVLLYNLENRRAVVLGGWYSNNPDNPAEGTLVRLTTGEKPWQIQIHWPEGRDGISYLQGAVEDGQVIPQSLLRDTPAGQILEDAEEPLRILVAPQPLYGFSQSLFLEGEEFYPLEPDGEGVPALEERLRQAARGTPVSRDPTHPLPFTDMAHTLEPVELATGEELLGWTLTHTESDAAVYPATGLEVTREAAEFSGPSLLLTGKLFIYDEMGRGIYFLPDEASSRRLPLLVDGSSYLNCSISDEERYFDPRIMGEYEGVTVRTSGTLSFHRYPQTPFSNGYANLELLEIVDWGQHILGTYVQIPLDTPLEYTNFTGTAPLVTASPGDTVLGLAVEEPTFYSAHQKGDDISFDFIQLRFSGELTVTGTLYFTRSTHILLDGESLAKVPVLASTLAKLEEDYGSGFAPVVVVSGRKVSDSYDHRDPQLMYPGSMLKVSSIRVGYPDCSYAANAHIVLYVDEVERGTATERDFEPLVMNR